jgi:hypothetical protein
MAEKFGKHWHFAEVPPHAVMQHDCFGSESAGNSPSALSPLIPTDIVDYGPHVR